VLTAGLAGIFGLAGVAVGAVLTPAMNRRADERRDLESAKAAWLLLQEDARAALETVQERLARGTWPIVAHQDWSSVWRSSRGSLVRHVDKETFRSVAEAFGRMDRLESAVNTQRDPGKRPLTNDDRRFLADMTTVLASAQAALDREDSAPRASSPSWRRRSQR